MREELDSIIAEMRKFPTSPASGKQCLDWADRLAALAPSAPGVDDAMVERARAAHSVDRISNGALIDRIAGPSYGDRLIRGILQAALTQPTEGSGPSVADAQGEREAGNG